MVEGIYKNAILFLAPKIKTRLQRDYKGKIKVDDNFIDNVGDIIQELFGYVDRTSGPEAERAYKALQTYVTYNAYRAIQVTKKLKLSDADIMSAATKRVNFQYAYDAAIYEAAQATKNRIIDLGREYIEGITQEVSSRWIAGASVSDLIQAMSEYTDGDMAKAGFWARDQLGDVTSSYNKSTQTSEGIEKYIWKTFKDNKVRENHQELSDRIFTWENGAIDTGLLDKEGAMHPGDDWQCRCWSYPYVGDEEAE
jgi:uncharacterized protein with gpF-like domain